MLGAIKTAKHYGLGAGRRDRHRRHRRRGDVRQRARPRGSRSTSRTASTSVGAAEVFGEHLLGAATDHLRELTHEERERIFNLGYYTWVEQQGVSIEDFAGAPRPVVLEAGAARRSTRWDELIDEFNARTGVLESL